MLLGYSVLSIYVESLLWKPLVGNEPYAFNKPMIAIYYETEYVPWIFHYNQYIKFMIWAISYPTRRYYIKQRTDNEHTKTYRQKTACPLISPSIQQITIPLHRIFIWNRTQYIADIDTGHTIIEVLTIENRLYFVKWIQWCRWFNKTL